MVANTFLDEEDKVYTFDQLSHLRHPSENFKGEHQENYQPPQPEIMAPVVNNEGKTKNGVQYGITFKK